VYYIPSKTALVGLLGAMIGVERGHGISKTYDESYVELLKRVRVGLRFETTAEKVSFFTNHRSLKETKTKPFKTELVVHPCYRVFVTSDDYATPRSVYDTIAKASYSYPPYLGHAYCPATVSEPVIYEQASELESLTFRTSCVILDESETYDKSFSVDQIEPIDEPGIDSSLIIERHLHHFIEGGRLEKRVLKHWIPVANSRYEVTVNRRPKLSKIVRLGESEECVSLY